MTERPDVETIDDITIPQYCLGMAGLEAMGARHLRLIFQAVHAYDCRLALIWQRSPRFRFFGDRPVIGVIGDDTDRALGPKGFHRKSIARFLASCRTISIVSSGAEPVPYAATVGVAVVTRKNVCVIETRPEREHEWKVFAERAQPDAQLIICKPRAH